MITLYMLFCYYCDNNLIIVCGKVYIFMHHIMANVMVLYCFCRITIVLNQKNIYCVPIIALCIYAINQLVSKHCHLTLYKIIGSGLSNKIRKQD